MVEFMLAYENINILHTDVRQVHAGFCAIENKSSKDAENILRLLLQKAPTMVVNLQVRSTKKLAISRSSSPPSAKVKSNWSRSSSKRELTLTGRYPTPATQVFTTPLSNSKQK
jgi:hypothetical protein